MQLVAISYDPVEVLAKFSEKAEVDFPLLSDPRSKTIEAYGVLNREATKPPFKGIAHPVTFLIDSNGVIRAKLSREGYRERHTVDELIKAARNND